MRAVRIASAVAASALLVGALAACGSSAKKSTDVLPTAVASAAGAGAGGGAAGSLGPKADLLAAAAVMQKAGSAKLAVSSAGGKADEGTGLYSWGGAQPAMDISEQQSGQAMKVRMVGGVMYLGVSDQQAAAVGGKHWIKLDGTGPAGSMTANFQALAMMVNPAVQLTAAAQGGKLSKVGSESLDGASTEHYQSVMPTATMVASVPNLSDADRKTVLTALTQEGSTITSDFWLNGQHQLVQQKEVGTNDASAAPSADQSTATTTKYSDFGVKVTVTAPPASDQVAPADQLKLLGVMMGG